MYDLSLVGLLKLCDKYLLPQYKALKNYFGIKNPKIALAAINPHASEDGNIGNDDQRITFPAVSMARKKKIFVEGPFPSDTLFVYNNRKKYCCSKTWF